MTDAFDVVTPLQRGYVFLAILAYFVLFAIEVATGNPAAAALSDLVITALAIPAGIVVARRATAPADTDWVALLAALAFLVAGVAVGYGGLSALTDLDEVAVVEALGSAALLLALVLYLYREWA